MYRFKDYYDESKRLSVYADAAEERKDYLRLLDMVLEGCLENMRARRSDGFASENLPGREAALADYFELPPYLRETERPDSALAEDAAEALSYIEERVKYTAYGENGAETVCRITYMRRQFGLDEAELLAVLLALAVEIDRKYGDLCRLLQDDGVASEPTVWLMNLLAESLTGGGNGGEDHLLRSPDEPFFTYFFRWDEGGRWQDTRLRLHPLMRKVLLFGIADSLDDSSWKGVYDSYEEEKGIPVFFERELPELSALYAQRRTAFCYIESEDGDAVLHILSHLCRTHGERLYVMDLRQLARLQPRQREECLSDLFVRLKLCSGRVCIRYADRGNEETDGRGEGAYALLAQLEHDFPKYMDGVVFLFGEKEEPGELALKPVPFVRLKSPDVQLRMRIWEHFLGREADGAALRIGEDVVIPDLADCYELSYGDIRTVCTHIREGAAIRTGGVIGRTLVLESLGQLHRVNFAGFATYVKATYTWEDIRIADEQKETLQIACDRYRLRNRIGENWGLKRRNTYGNGVSVLLYGPPGTGKTMAAQVVARELGLPLYRVDISRIFSKYIGETEKNLAVIFEAAQKANVILFFDEADSLFSKRTEVKDSNDKFANNEAAFLLQKIEEYDGMSMLATNYFQNFDSAFVRRITYFVHMGEPDEQTRYVLWTTILPEETPVAEDVDFHFLSRQFALSGSNIKAILYNAAYMAGARDVPVGKEQIYKALKYEYEKMGKVIDISQFDEEKEKG